MSFRGFRVEGCWSLCRAPGTGKPGYVHHHHYPKTLPAGKLLILSSWKPVISKSGEITKSWRLAARPSRHEYMRECANLDYARDHAMSELAKSQSITLLCTSLAYLTYTTSRVLHLAKKEYAMSRHRKANAYVSS